MSASASASPAAAPAERRPYSGSCHCGRVRYTVQLALPLQRLPDDARGPRNGPVAYRCNCTMCHKAGLLHLRLPSAPDDFALHLPPAAELQQMQQQERLASPQDGGGGDGDPLAGLVRAYRCNKRVTRWYFCPVCGVRCFGMTGGGQGVVDEGTDGAGAAQRTWRLSREGWDEARRGQCYLSVNAHSLDAGQEGLDLRAWHEGGTLMYINELGVEGFSDRKRYGQPFPGGCY